MPVIESFPLDYPEPVFRQVADALLSDEAIEASLAGAPSVVMNAESAVSGSAGKQVPKTLQCRVHIAGTT